MLSTFGKRLRLLRIERGVKQIELEDALKSKGLKFRQSYISTLENSKDNRVPGGAIVAAVATELDTTSDFLLLLSDDPHKKEGKPEYETV